MVVRLLDWMFEICGSKHPKEEREAKSHWTTPRRPCNQGSSRYLFSRIRAQEPPISTQQSNKEEKIEMEGEVIEALRNGFFRIALDNGHETLGYTAGKMRRYRIRIFPGDRIKVELSAYDLGRGRIVYRYRD
jgi:translation initiation factor IF-1